MHKCSLLFNNGSLLVSRALDRQTWRLIPTDMNALECVLHLCRVWGGLVRITVSLLCDSLPRQITVNLRLLCVSQHRDRKQHGLSCVGQQSMPVTGKEARTQDVGGCERNLSAPHSSAPVVSWRRV